VSEPSARKRFVETMRHFLIGRMHALSSPEEDCCPAFVRQAAEAFADAECDSGRWSGKPDCRRAVNAHEACRAALLKEIGL